MAGSEIHKLEEGDRMVIQPKNISHGESNPCPQCGGQKTPIISISAYQTNTTVPSYPMHAPTTHVWPTYIQFCCCPQPRHDGDLGHNATVWYEDVSYSSSTGPSFSCCEVAISDKMRHVYLIPSEALSLLRWLQQERPHLEQLVQEQSGD